MLPSRGMGAIAHSKVPKTRTIKKRDGDEPVALYAKGGFLGGLKKGALHEDLGVPAGEKIPAKKLDAAAKKPGKVGRRARLAETMKSWHKK